MTSTAFVVLHDPSREELVAALEGTASDEAASRLADKFITPTGARVSLRQEGEHIFGSLLIPQLVAEENRVAYEELNLIITAKAVLVLTSESDDVGRTGRGSEWTEILRTARAGGRADDAGRVIHKLFDSGVDRYEALAVDLESEIDEVESAFEEWSGEQVQTRLRELRRDLITSRRNLVLLKEGLRRISDDAVDLDENRFFSRDLDLRFRDTYERVLRVNESLDSLRDFVGGVRDAHQAYVAQKQNEVMQRLTVVASILLVPTLIVGIYGQNFVEMPETRWAHGYLWSWGLILLVTLGQLIYFKKRGYLGSASSKRMARREWTRMRRASGAPEVAMPADPDEKGLFRRGSRSPEKVP